MLLLLEEQNLTIWKERADDLKWQAGGKPVQNLDQTVYKTVTCSMCLRRTSTKSLKVDPVNNTQKTQHDLGN